MFRRSRVILPGYPYHLTQRGHRRQAVFFDDRDRRDFLGILRSEAERSGLRIWAWVLMSNHIHLVGVPEESASIDAVLRASRDTYASLFLDRYPLPGPVWQGRCYRSVLDRQEFLWRAVRYVERNPVAAGMVPVAEAWPWSSAAFHCGVRCSDPLIAPDSPLVGALDDWSGWLKRGGRRRT